MLETKKFEKTILRLTVIVLVFSLILVCFPNIFSWISKDSAGEDYNVKLFGRDVLEIEITANEDDWNNMLANKLSKPYIACDIKIDGREFTNVGIRPKGNSSLTNITGNKIGFRLDFDQYIDNQTCYGLEQLVLNNLQADATYMKDYIAYDLMIHEGVNAPLHTFAFLTLNGEPFGVYLAAEVYDEDYLSRVYNDTTIKLYNVKSSGFNDFENAIVDPENGTVVKSLGMLRGAELEEDSMIEPPGGLGGGNLPTPPTGNGNLPAPPPGGGNLPTPPSSNGDLPVSPPGDGNLPTPPSSNGNLPAPPPSDGNLPAPPVDGQVPQMPDTESSDESGFTPPPLGGEGGGSDLMYVDESTASYRNIFANAVSTNASAKDYAKVIRAIYYLNKENVTNEELEKYWDIDAILRYLAVHTFMVNGDSYTGHMKQNFYLAERDGKVTVLPWDYNLSFGGASLAPPPIAGQGGMPPAMPSEEVNTTAEIPSLNVETTELVNHAIDTPLHGVEMDSRPLISVLLSRDKYKEKYHRYLDKLTEYVSNDYIEQLEIIESAIYPYIERETVGFYTPEAHKKAFEVLKKFMELRCQSIQGQLNGTIPSETELQKEAQLIPADFSHTEMGSMGIPEGGPPATLGGNVDNVQGGMMPPGATGTTQTQEKTGYVTDLIALLVLGIVFIGAKLFKRKY